MISGFKTEALCQYLTQSIYLKVHTVTWSDANRLNDPTCRFGPGKDEGSCTTSLDLMVACVDVYTVDSEWFQVEDFH